MASYVFYDIQDALEKLDTLREIVGAHEEKLSELADDSKEAKENQAGIEESVGKVMQKLDEIKTELASILPGLGKLHEVVKQHMAEVIAALQVVQKPVEQEKLTMDKFELAPKFQEMLLRHKTDILTRQNEMEKSLAYHCRKLDIMFLQKQNHLEENLVKKINQLEQQMQQQLNRMEEMNLTKHKEITQRFDTVVGLLQKFSIVNTIGL